MSFPHRAACLAALSAVALMAACASSSSSDSPETVVSIRLPLAVRTQRNGNIRSGLYLGPEFDVSTINSRTFGKVGEYPVDGLIYTQPLTADNVPLPSGGVKNLVFVGTSKNTMYAFDADSGSSTPVWQTNFGTPMDNSGAMYPCFASRFQFGILSTPVISKTTMYLVAETDPHPDPNYCTSFDVFPTPRHTFVHTLYAIDIRTGAIINSAVVGGTAPGPYGAVQFESLFELQRAGLLFSQNTVYMAFAMNNDQPYDTSQGNAQGWIFAYDGTTLDRTAVYCSTCSASPDDEMGGGIWQGGAGLAADPDGDVYAITGNGYTDTDTLQPNARGSSVIRFDAKLNVLDWFTPFNYGPDGYDQPPGGPDPNLNVHDLDLGSSGPTLIPGTNKTFLLAGGKVGKLYVLGAKNLGRYHVGSDSQIPFSLQATSNQYIYPEDQRDYGEYSHIHGPPLYSPYLKRVFVWGERDVLRSFDFDPNTGALAFHAQSDGPPAPKTMPGGMIALSSDASGAHPVLWAAVRTEAPLDSPAEDVSAGTLRAFDPSTLKEIWRADQTFRFPKFPSFSIAHGKVYVPTFEKRLLVYGARTCGGDAGTRCRRATVGDFDGDGVSDIAVYEPGTGAWSIRGATDSPTLPPAGTPVPADYNGDGKIDRATWNPATGEWNSIDAGLNAVQWGAPGDIPVPGDYRGDGTAQLAVFRPSTGEWLVRDVGTFNLGTAGDVPVPGDYDGDGRDDPAVWRPSEHRWLVLNMPDTPAVFTDCDDCVPVPGDYDGDGTMDRMLWLPDSGQWFNASLSQYVLFNMDGGWGTPGDIPIPGDFNGDGKADYALYRPSNGNWLIVDRQTACGCNDSGCIGCPLGVAAKTLAYNQTRANLDQIIAWGTAQSWPIPSAPAVPSDGTANSGN